MQIDPYRFHGDWIQEEKQTILDTLFAHTPRKVNSETYNVWHFTSGDGEIMYRAQRDKFDPIMPLALTGDTAQELADELHRYYIT